MTTYVGRNARLYIEGVVVALAKNIKVQASAEAVKEHTMDDEDPSFLESGNRTYKFSLSKVIGEQDMLQLLLDGTKFDVIFAASGSTETPPTITITDCIVLDYSESAGEAGGVLCDVSGEGTGMTKT
ncbi:hypothetical protein MUO79_01025 [Candidatus Bathyarchaeota archaeon]|nr:hypothetical protein [Candidatus Bathyarchaeota archaeon]